MKDELELNQYEIIQSQNNLFARFAMNQYKLAQINYENATKPFNSFMDRPGRTINNYYLMRH